MSALPAAINYIFSISASWIADTILIKQWMSKTATRKLMMFLGKFYSEFGVISIYMMPISRYEFSFALKNGIFCVQGQFCQH